MEPMMNDLPESLRRVAILVSTLDTADADRLLDQLPAEQSARLRQAIVDLPVVDADEEKSVIDEFLRGSMPASEAIALADRDGGVELCLSAEPTLSVAEVNPSIVEVQGIPTRADGASRQVHAAPLASPLAEAAQDRLAAVLAGERPQTIALALSRLPETMAMEVLAALPTAVQSESLRRWIELDDIDAELIHEIEEELRARIVERFGGLRRKSGGLAHVAGTVQAAEPRLQRQMLTNLARIDAAVVEQITMPRLAFDDLEYLNDAGLASLVRRADPHVLLLALAGANEAFVERVLEKLPGSSGRRWRRSLEALGPTRLADIDAAQQQLAGLAETIVNQSDKVSSPLAAHEAA